MYIRKMRDHAARLFERCEHPPLTRARDLLLRTFVAKSVSMGGIDHLPIEIAGT